VEIAPIDLISNLLFKQWKYNDGEEDYTVMRVLISDEKEKYEYTLLDRYSKETATSSMARTTGYTCTAAAQLLLKNKFTRKGICPPEYIGENENCFHDVLRYLEERNVIYKKRVLA
jgi:saccharopine dehydrogenase-like NADP-dependent oxidoreductase